MTRGKYAQRATVRQEQQAVEASIESYRHAVARLTSENADLKQKLAAEQSQHVKDVRVLKAMNEQAVSPELKAAYAEIAKLRDERDRQSGEIKSLRKTWNRVFLHMVGILHAEGWTKRDALDLLSADAESLGAVVADLAKNPSMNAERALMMERTQGERAAKRKQDDPEWQARYAEAAS